MNAPEIRDLGLAPAGGTCACCAPAGHTRTRDAGSQAVDVGGNASPSEGGITADYLVAGMTCSHCVSSVSEEVSAIDGVADVDVDLNAGGASRVRVSSAYPIDAEKIRTAIEEAGYTLSSAS